MMKYLLSLALLFSIQTHAAVTDRDKAELGVERNYLTNGGCESATAGYSAFHTTFAGGIPTTITAGSTKLSVTSTSLNVLEGQASCQMLVTTAASSTGHGIITDPITIKDADLAKVIATQLDYNFISGIANVDVSGTSTQTVEVWIYNVGLASWYQPAGFASINTKGTAGQLVPGRTPTITFQSDVSNVSNKNQYRIAWIIKNDPLGTFSMNFDNVTFGRPTRNSGPAVTDFRSFPMIITGTVSDPTKASSPLYDQAVWSRDGDSMIIHYDYGHNNNAGAADGSGTYLFTLPSGVTIDTNKAIANSTNASGNLGSASVSGTNVGSGHAKAYDSTHLAIFLEDVTSAVQSFWGTGYVGIAAADVRVSFTARVPIVGWSSDLQLSNDTDTRVVSAKYTGDSGGYTMSSLAPAQFNTQIYDDHAAVSTGMNWKFTAPVSGRYALKGTVFITAGSSDIFLYKNGINTNEAVTSTAVSTSGIEPFNTTIDLNGGDYIDIRSTVNITQTANPSYTNIEIERISGPSVIAANENVVASYQSDDAATPTSNVINYNTKLVDTHNAVVAGAGVWIFTAPVSGIYDIYADFYAGTSVSQKYIEINRNGSPIAKSFGNDTATYAQTISKDILYPLYAGDTIQIKTNWSAALFNSDPGLNLVGIKLIH